MAALQQIQQMNNEAIELYTEHQVHAALGAMAEQINAQMADSNPIVVCIMLGGVVTYGHLLTRLHFPLEVDYVHATRYRNETVGSELHWYQRPRLSMEGRNVLLVDDILDGGVTLAAIKTHCEAHGALNVRTAVLLDKYQKRVPDGLAKADYVGLPIEDHFVFGFGMDYHQYLRNLPGIYYKKDA